MSGGNISLRMYSYKNKIKDVINRNRPEIRDIVLAGEEVVGHSVIKEGDELITIILVRTD